MHLEDSVLEPFADKVLLTETSLDSTAITVRGVSLEDEGCYICSFNIYPKGTTRKQICLIVRGVRTVRTWKRPLVAPALDTEKPVVVTCSATGKPAPEVQWGVSEDQKSGPMETTSSNTNSDGTVTVTSSLRLDLSTSPRTHVDCLVGGQETQKRIMVSV
ncbi:OX-2 membrane glycoprotein-like [Scleropages formosus]|uniref:OX-2 membrane glycoprotein-like n=1 Tax=Scleropages formosus TaxID=113540 RepID=UPI0010FAB5ED|nr:OX-2 membrane glycoprotein-like [Scleropages formosus]